MKKSAYLLILSFGVAAFCQNHAAENFVLDRSKPYVYLQLDHIGPRKPIQAGEPSNGLWIRVVNNCRIPIVFVSLNAPVGESGVTLLDDVLEEEPILEISSKSQEEIAKASQARAEALKLKPGGYTAETAGFTYVQPGKNVLFSVPINHVGDEWFLRIKFALDLDRSSPVGGPFTYLDFHKFDIPKEHR